MTNKVLSDLARAIRSHICKPARTEHTESDIEIGKSIKREKAEAVKATSSENSSNNEFRKSLQMVLSEAERVDWIMKNIDEWEDNM